MTRLVREGQLKRQQRYQHGGLDRDDVEQLALYRYRPGHPYWARTVEAAAILGVSRERVRQLVEAGRLPAIDRDGRRYLPPAPGRGHRQRPVGALATVTFTATCAAIRAGVSR